MKHWFTTLLLWTAFVQPCTAEPARITHTPVQKYLGLLGSPLLIEFHVVGDDENLIYRLSGSRDDHNFVESLPEVTTGLESDTVKFTLPTPQKYLTYQLVVSDAESNLIVSSDTFRLFRSCTLPVFDAKLSLPAKVEANFLISEIKRLENQINLLKKSERLVREIDKL